MPKSKDCAISTAAPGRLLMGCAGFRSGVRCSARVGSFRRPMKSGRCTGAGARWKSKRRRCGRITTGSRRRYEAARNSAMIPKIHTTHTHNTHTTHTEFHIRHLWAEPPGASFDGRDLLRAVAVAMARDPVWRAALPVRSVAPARAPGAHRFRSLGCLSEERQWNTQGKGSVLAKKGSGTHKAEAVS